MAFGLLPSGHSDAPSMDASPLWFAPAFAAGAHLELRDVRMLLVALVSLRRPAFKTTVSDDFERTQYPG
jgi:hypothetical protein